MIGVTGDMGWKGGKYCPLRPILYTIIGISCPKLKAFCLDLKDSKILAKGHDFGGNLVDSLVKSPQRPCDAPYVVVPLYIAYNMLCIDFKISTSYGCILVDSPRLLRLST